MRSKTLALLAIAFVLAGCSSSEAPESAQAPAAQAPAAQSPESSDPQSPAALADAYAKKLSGGETLGCSSAAPGAESESDPGCIYSAAFTGCYEGITGERLGRPIEEEFPQEPALWDIYHQAADDCKE